ncbi:hypothetical protein [Noviherbaspirillum pedocola]|uniref:Uncharacterized protein n=1 Tax=Noviherbaspirillum pedocola TaxID=2801341 RepID=A0A934W407_9BURK|nr:hypothetical protein [Noviherbaspirillum pedocola]MBK4733392.1 hypothetical protein [Noviherbaspirillum pedocola]
MERWEVILEAGVEGGSIRLYGMHNEKGWIFSEDVVDQTPELIDKPGVHYRSKPVYTWEDALSLLDEYCWHCFFPLTVHPFFRGAVLAGVLNRSTLEEINDNSSLSNWLAICGEIPHVEWKLLLH